MGMGFQGDIYEGKGQPYEEYVGRYVRIGIRHVGIVKGIVREVDKNRMIINTGNSNSTIIDIEEISFFEPKELILISRK
jgi:hypothetical protein